LLLATCFEKVGGIYRELSRRGICKQGDEGTETRPVCEKAPVEMMSGVVREMATNPHSIIPYKQFVVSREIICP
jgi:hypothetical protein